MVWSVRSRNTIDALTTASKVPLMNLWPTGDSPACSIGLLFLAKFIAYIPRVSLIFKDVNVLFSIFLGPLLPRISWPCLQLLDPKNIFLQWQSLLNNNKLWVKSLPQLNISIMAEVQANASCDIKVMLWNLCTNFYWNLYTRHGAYKLCVFGG